MYQSNASPGTYKVPTQGKTIEVTSVINLTQGGAGGASWKFVYQIYPPPIDTPVTGMGKTGKNRA